MWTGYWEHTKMKKSKICVHQVLWLQGEDRSKGVISWACSMLPNREMQKGYTSREGKVLQLSLLPPEHGHSPEHPTRLPTQHPTCDPPRISNPDRARLVCWTSRLSWRGLTPTVKLVLSPRHGPAHHLLTTLPSQGSQGTFWPQYSTLWNWRYRH